MVRSDGIKLSGRRASIRVGRRLAWNGQPSIHAASRALGKHAASIRPRPKSELTGAGLALLDPVQCGALPLTRIAGRCF
jgi:hypothetical protein